MIVREPTHTTALRTKVVSPRWVRSFHNRILYHKPLLTKHHIPPQDLSGYFGTHLMTGKSCKTLTAPNLSPLVVYLPHSLFALSSSSVHPGHFHPVHQGAQVPGCPARPQRNNALRGRRPGQHHVQVVRRRQTPERRREALPGGKQPEVHLRGPAAGRRELRVRRTKHLHRRDAPFHQGLL